MVPTVLHKSAYDAEANPGLQVVRLSRELFYAV